MEKFTLTDCTFIDNEANDGGGAIFGGIVTLTGCTFIGNTAVTRGGGASFFRAATLTGCTFTDNSRNDRGRRLLSSSGGAFFGGAATLTGCTFTGNTSNSFSGGASFSGAATLTGCTFTGNTANTVSGGANFRGAATLTGCTFTGNTADSRGGGAYFSGEATLANCVVIGNRASDGGGLLFFSGGTVINSTFYNNTATERGGGIWVFQGDIDFGMDGVQTNPFNLQNSLLMGNTATIAGNAIYLVDGVAPLNATDIEASIDHNLISGGMEDLGVGLYDQDADTYTDVPFADATNVVLTNTIEESDTTAVFASLVAIEEGYLHLRAGSPAVNAGNNDYLNNGTPGNPDDDIETDAAGEDRIQNGVVDLGAYESVFKGTQVLTFTSDDAGTVGTDIELVATASSTLPVTFAITVEFEVDGTTPSTTGEVATLADGSTTLRLTGIGTVEITATQEGNANYVMATQTQIITVSQGTQTLTFTSDTTGTVGMDIELMATASSGLDVTFAITEGDTLATLVDSTLSLTGVGKVIITAMQVGNANYAKVTQTQTITVSQGTQTIMFTSDTTGNVGTNIELAATASSTLPVTFEITTGDTLATLADNTLSLIGVGTVTITATQEGNANYADTMQTQTITVSQGTQTITFTSDTTGNVGTNIELMATASSTLPVTFEITTGDTLATLADNTLSLTGVGTVEITATQEGNANYADTMQTQIITVSQGTQTITFTSDTTGTVGTEIELAATVSSTLPVTFAITEGDTLATLADNTLSLTGIGTVTITATQEGNTNYAEAMQTQTITVSQGTQTITFTSDTTGNVGTNIELAATASSTLPVTFEITTGDTLATLADNTLSLIGVGTVTITATQEGNANYADTMQTQTITVSQGTQTITFTSDTTGNVGTNIELMATASSTLPVTFEITTGDTLATLADNTLSLTGVGTVTITATQEGNTNYAEAMQTQTITVSQGTQTITFTSDTTGNVGTNIELAATASSTLPVTFEITTGDTLATLADNTLSLTGIGTVTITATQEGNTNYAEAMQTQTITVSQGTQTITFTSDTTGNVGTNIELMATASSTLPVTFEITTGDTLATLADNTLSLTGVGTVTITATQEGNTNYAEAMQTQTITVSQGTQTITFTSDTIGTVGTEIELAATVSSTLPVTFAITEGDTLATLADNTLSLTGIGTVTITATQEGNTNYAEAMQTQTITVSQGTQTITFTSDTTGNVGTNIELAATASSTLPVTFEITTNPTAGVATLTDDGTGDGMGSLTLTGAGTITVTASQAGNANYAAATPVERTITVNAVLGIENAVDDLVLYPNPTSGKLHFSEQVEEFLLYSSEGRLLDTWKNVRSADLTALPSGLYFVEVIRGGRSVGYRIVRK